MNPNPSLTTWLNFPSIALALAVAANLLWFNTPLRTFRPDKPTSARNPRPTQQNIEARLWQDPLEAIHAAVSQAGHSNSNPRGFSEVERALLGDNPLLMPVLTDGSPSTGGAEWRRRTRQAVVAGLGASAFIPRDREHIGIFQRTTADGSIHLHAYEWFDLDRGRLGTNQTRPSSILVLWVAEDDIALTPLASLESLHHQVAQALALQPSRMPMHAIGPNGSTTLAAMHQEVLPERLAGDTNRVRFALFSPTATAPDSLLFHRAGSGGSVPDRAYTSEFLRERGIQFTNLTCTDDQLAQAIVEELHLRNVDCKNGSLVLLSEWDTSYGRILPVAVSNAWAREHRAEKQTFGVHFRYYLRGLDGEPPKRQESDTAKPRDREGRLEVGMLEVPEGNSQLDSLPRLADQLEELEGANSGHIAAIGILGSDIYDKLLLLQSLRARFPGALFFTTDVNALFSHAPQLPWTRNLVVASSYGLSLHPDRQRGVPPFRDSYQTATFLAVTAATGADSPPNPEELQPRIHEIANRGPWELATTNTTPATASPIHPSLAKPGIGGKKSICLPVLALLGLLLVVQFHSSVRNWLKLLFLAGSPGTPIPVPFARWSRFTFRFVLWAATLFPVAFLLVLIREHQSIDAEPLALFEGISIWPTELLRISGVYLGIGLLIHGRRCLVENKRDILLEFGLPFHSRKVSFGREWTQALRSNCLALLRSPSEAWRWYLNTASLTRLGPDRSPKCHDLLSLWRTYNELGFLWNRVLRIAPAALAYGAFVIVLHCTIRQPVNPARGDWSHNVHIGVNVVSTGLQILLTFAVIDATRLCSAFIRALVAGKVIIPPRTRHQIAKQTAAPAAILPEITVVRLIARRTDAVGRLIYFPFLTLFILIVSRNSFFDRWEWTPGLVLEVALSSALAIYSVILLHRCADQARTQCLAPLQDALAHALVPGAATAPTLPQIKHFLTEIRDCEEGAFAPIAKNPVVGAVLVPFGGAGVLAVLEFITHLRL